MGTKKKLVLASVVSMMLVLAFLVGFLPSYDTGRTGADKAGRVDMAGLLDMILDNGDKAIDTINPNSGFDGFTVKTSTQNVIDPYLFVPVTSATTGTGGELVYYTANPSAANPFGVDAGGKPFWTGDDYYGVFNTAPYALDLDANDYWPATAGLNALAVNALVTAKAIYGADGDTGLYANTNPDTIWYLRKNSAADRVVVNFQTVNGAAVDADANGVPNDPFGAVGDNMLWTANVNKLDQSGGNVVRTVMVASLTQLPSSILTPVENIEVEVPTLDMMVGEGLASSVDDVLVVIQVVNDLAAAVDSVDGNASQSAKNAWALGVLNALPGAPVTGAPVVEISYLKKSGSTVSTLKDLGTLETVVRFLNVVAPDNANEKVVVMGADTECNTSALFVNVPGKTAHVVDANPVVGADTIEARFSALSALVPVVTTLRVDESIPAVIPENTTVDVTLLGVFPTYMAAQVYGLTAAEADAAYNVYINGTLAAFREVAVTYGLDKATIDVAVTGLTGSDPDATNEMYLTVAGINNPGITNLPVDVQVVETANNNVATAVGAIQVVPTAVVNVTTSGTGSGSVELNPLAGAVGDIALPANTYAVGDIIVATATPATADDVFAGWSVFGSPVGLTNPYAFTVSGDTDLDAAFNTVATKVFLTLETPANGTLVADPPMPTEGYDVDTVVTLTATPNNGFKFSAWTGANGSEVTNNTIVMNGNKTVGVEFAKILELISVDPNIIPDTVQVPMVLTGRFPTYMAQATPLAGLTLDEAAANYLVKINGVDAAFRTEVVEYDDGTKALVQAPVAVTRYVEGQANEMYVTSPIIDLPDNKAVAVTVTIEDLNDPALVISVPALLEVQAVGTVNVTLNGAGSVALDPPNGEIQLSVPSKAGSSVVLPPNVYVLGTPVSATATPDTTTEFIGWTLDGEQLGVTNPLDFTVDATNIALAASFAVPGQKFEITVTPPVNGAITLDPPQPVDGYDAGTSVTVTAVPDATFLFSAWTGDLAATLANPATLVMDTDKTVGAVFVPEGANFALDLTVTAGGTVAVTPAGTNTFPAGTVVTLTATPNVSFQFSGWSGANAADLAPDTTAATVTLLMNGNKSIVANFNQVLHLTGITPNWAWIFGGVTAKITGTGLDNNVEFDIGGKKVWGFNGAADGTSIEVVIPATDDRSVNALVLTYVKARKGAIQSAVEDTLPFTYKRYDNAANGKNTTAFILDNPTAENTVNVTTGAGDIQSANLIIPGLGTNAAKVYGIVLNQKLMALATKATTAPVPTGSLSSALIDGAGKGESIENAYDFSVYLYTAPAAKATTPSADSQLPFFNDASAQLLNFARGQNEDGTPNAGNGMLLTFPLDNAALNYGDVRTGLTMWGIEGQYNYVNNIESVTEPEVIDYQSMLLANEVDPALTAAAPDSAKPEQVLKARLYTLNGFSLRKNAVLPEEVVQAIRLAKVDGVDVNGTGKGPKKGGTKLTLVSPLGGLGYVDRIELVKPGTKLFGTLGGVATSKLFVTEPGTDEYNFEFKTPKSGKAGIVDMVIYLKSNPTTPAAVLPKSFEYTRQSCNVTPLLLLLLGVIAAIIGLAAGGDSGGGGGGPCFIATAAYGTTLASDIDTLRSVRDAFMLDNAVGTAFVDAYYRVSPAVADVVAQSPVLAAMVRMVLVPVIFLGKVALLMPVPTALVALSLGFAFMLRRRARGRA